MCLNHTPHSSQIKLSRIAPNPRNSLKFSPLKVSCYTIVGKPLFCSRSSTFCYFTPKSVISNPNFPGEGTCPLVSGHYHSASAFTYGYHFKSDSYMILIYSIIHVHVYTVSYLLLLCCSHTASQSNCRLSISKWICARYVKLSYSVFLLAYL